MNNNDEEYTDENNKRPYQPYQREIGNLEYLPDEILKHIYTNVLEEFPTKEQAKCGSKKYESNKYLKNFLQETTLYNHLPSVKEYQENNIYILQNENSNKLPFLISCKSICQNYKNCIPNDLLLKQDTGEDMYKIIPPLLVNHNFHSYITVTNNELRNVLMNSPNDINSFLNTRDLFNRIHAYENLNSIFWNCSCLVIELKIGYINNLLLLEQRIFNNNEEFWTIAEIINEIINFYDETFTENEAIQLIPILKQEQENLTEETLDMIYILDHTKETWFSYRYAIPEKDIDNFLTIEYLTSIKRSKLCTNKNKETLIINALEIRIFESPHGEYVPMIITI